VVAGFQVSITGRIWVSTEDTIEERKSAVWWIWYTRNGKEYNQSSESKLKKDAVAMLTERQGDILRGKPITPRLGKVTFEEAGADVVADYRINKKKSVDGVERRLRLHLTPVFDGWRMANITTPDVRKFIVQRQAAGASNAEINRETGLLRRMFSLAVQGGKLLHRPHIPMLREDNVRTGFFEPEQYRSVLAHLPEDIRGVVTFAYITGWRVQSEVLPLQWRNVDFSAGEVRLDPGTTKNKKGRVFPFTNDLRTLLETQYGEHQRLKAEGKIVPYVFARDGEPIGTFKKAWRAACKAAGCPGRIPHDLRRTAVRNLVRAGISESVAMTMTGHKTRSVFDRYDISSDNDLRDAAKRLDDAATAAAGKK
jgi:integrase